MGLVGQHCNHAVLDLCKRLNGLSPASQVHSNVNSRDTTNYSLIICKIAAAF
jgi:hypothetical protein